MGRAPVFSWVRPEDRALRLVAAVAAVGRSISRSVSRSVSRSISRSVSRSVRRSCVRYVATGLGRAAATLGASPADRLRRIVLPAILPGVAAAALLAFLTAAGEFPASILLHIPENLPVSVKINTLFRNTRYGPPFAYATLLLALQLVVLGGAAWATRRKRRA